MNKLTDPRYLAESQYHTSSNLSKRASLHRDFGTNPKPWQLWLMNQFKIPGKSLVLELGSGPGYLWQENIKTIPVGWEIILTDISGGMLQESRAILSPKKGFSHVVADALEIPFPAGRFDAVIANHMLYHVRDLDQTIKNIKRVLKTGGTLYAATNAPGHLGELFALEKAFLGQERENVNFWAESFNLNNGAEILAPYFQDISRRDYPNQLVVTHPDAIISYLESKTERELDSESVSKLTEHLIQVIRDNGSFQITSLGGLFICQ